MFRYRMDTTAMLVMLGLALALFLMAAEWSRAERSGWLDEGAPAPVQVAYGTRGG